MISGAHMIIYTKDAEADRAFFRDVLRFPFIDVGHGWLIFRLPPSEVGIHPAEENGKQEIYLMCEDLTATINSIESHGIKCSPVTTQPWGMHTDMTLPGGGKLGLYQPRHATPPSA